MSKENFDKKLITLLESNPDFVDEAGELHRANVRERAWKLDPELIKLLLTDKEIEAKFFKEIEGRWIFDNNAFVNYITDKNFFTDSYTQFRNKSDSTSMENSSLNVAKSHSSGLTKTVSSKADKPANKKNDKRSFSTNSSRKTKSTACLTPKSSLIGGDTVKTCNKR